jgi:hypothetical protein
MKITISLDILYERRITAIMTYVQRLKNIVAVPTSAAITLGHFGIYGI